MSIEVEHAGTFESFWDTFAFVVNNVIFFFSGMACVNFAVRCRLWGPPPKTSTKTPDSAQFCDHPEMCSLGHGALHSLPSQAAHCSPTLQASSHHRLVIACGWLHSSLPSVEQCEAACGPRSGPLRQCWGKASVLNLLCRACENLDSDGPVYGAGLMHPAVDLDPARSPNAGIKLCY